jgi:hypothetical protein
VGLIVPKTISEKTYEMTTPNISVFITLTSNSAKFSCRKANITRIGVSGLAWTPVDFHSGAIETDRAMPISVHNTNTRNGVILQICYDECGSIFIVHRASFEPKNEK